MMNMDSTNTRPPKFEGKNFQGWKKHMLLFLTMKELNSMIEDYEVPEGSSEKTIQMIKKKEAMTQDFILGSLSLSMQEQVKSCTTAVETWNRLLAIYENKSESTIGRMLRDYYSLRNSISMTMSKYIAQSISKWNITLLETHIAKVQLTTHRQQTSKSRLSNKNTISRQTKTTWWKQWDSDDWHMRIVALRMHLSAHFEHETQKNKKIGF